METATEAKPKRIMTLQDGDAVIYVDEYAFERQAIATAVWGSKELDLNDEKAQFPAINLAFVNPNEKMTDQYGRQLIRACSVTHRRHAGTCPGRYWFKPEENTK